MKKIYFLKTCDTCRRIIKELNPDAENLMREIAAEPISEVELDEMVSISGSYESLINKRAKLFAERNLKDKNLTEMDFKSLLLEHYTFLKRPVILVDDSIFIGNASKTVLAAHKALHL